MRGLQSLLNQLEKGRAVHISILDLRGILTSDKTRIVGKSMIHSRNFCDKAKSTGKGYRLCLKCKSLATQKAKNSKVPFDGLCAYGIHEAVFPVVINENVVAIVFVGNAVTDPELTRKKIDRATAFSGVCRESLSSGLDECEVLNSAEDLYEIGEIVSDYLKLLTETTAITGSGEHWMIPVIKQYAKENLNYSISIEDIAQLYQKNPQYIGRLFKQTVGVSFSEYCNSLRLSKALSYLKNSDWKIIDIAYECGFNSVTYFNKIFKSTYGVSPSEYKKQ